MKQEMLRAPVLWFGGKGKMIKKLMNHMPLGGKPYCEPFMGAATLFFARPPTPVEVLNDTDNDLVNLFKCLQDKNTFDELAHKLRYTLYARAEFVEAIEILKDKSITDKVLRAWAFFVKLNMSINHTSSLYGVWGRAFVSRNGYASNVNSNWFMRLTMLDDWHKRLLMAQIDNRDALEVIKYWDSNDTVFYIDPPYILDTRKSKNVYNKELNNDYHKNLVKIILDCKGAVVLSGYEHELYQPLIDAGWECTKYHTACFGACRTKKSKLQGKNSVMQRVPRVECVYSNPKAVNLIKTQGEKENAKLQLH
jgi:DNA adenine methylase